MTGIAKILKITRGRIQLVSANERYEPRVVGRWKPAPFKLIGSA